MQLKKAITLPRDLNQILRDLNTQRGFLREHIQPVTSSFMDTHDGSLDEKDIQKIYTYYGLAVPAILGEAFCLLFGRKMSGQERTCSTAQGAMTGLFDDFFDKQFLEVEHIHTSISAPDSLSNSSNERLFSWFYQKVLATAPDPELVKLRLMDVHLAQVESKKQVGGKLHQKELLSLTLQKGSTSLLFYYSAFNKNIHAIENELIGELGGWMQLSNDIFDVYKDREAGIDTLVTTCKNIEALKFFFIEGIKTSFSKAQQLPFKKGHISAFLNRLSIGIFSRCLVCLNQLESLQSETNGQFDVKAYTRKQLICDMDTAGNKIKSLWQHVNI